MNKNIILAAFACFFLFVAGLIYLCFRSPTLLLFRWLDLIGFNYSFFQNVGLKLPAFFIYNLPNALFLIFGYIFVYVIWNSNKYYLFYVSIITLLNIIYESATHDISDIITICITFIICLIIYYRYSGVKHET
jgi:hypothetical protein